MDDKKVFSVVKKSNGNLAYCDAGMKTDDVLTLLAMTTSYVYDVAKTKIGLTHAETVDNIENAVNAGINNAIDECNENTNSLN